MAFSARVCACVCATEKQRFVRIRRKITTATSAYCCDAVREQVLRASASERPAARLLRRADKSRPRYVEREKCLHVSRVLRISRVRQTEWLRHGIRDRRFAVGKNTPEFSAAQERNQAVETGGERNIGIRSDSRLQSRYVIVGVYTRTPDRAFYVSGEVDVFWRFYDNVSLDHWIVTSDSDHAEGFSKCDLKINQRGYGIFSGNLCSRVPKDGRIQNSGYCNIITKRVAVTRYLFIFD